MRYGARNAVTGEVKSVKKGDIMSLVRFDVSPCEMGSGPLPPSRSKRLYLQPGEKVRLVVKAVNVLPVKE